MLPVLLHRDPVDADGRIFAEASECSTESRLIDVMCQREDPPMRIDSRSLRYLQQSR